MRCNCCLKEKKEYLSRLCKECSDKIDKHIQRTNKVTKLNENIK